jgi:hypothetical protein
MTQVPSIAQMFEQLRAEVREARFTAILVEARAWAARKQAEQVPMGPSSPDFPTSWPTSITLNHVLRWRDADFVHACYQAILRRPPEPAGFMACLNEVRSGRSRIEIAVGFVRSEEGRRAGVQVAGVQSALFLLRLGRIPVLGYLLRLAKGILMLPRQAREREAVEAYLLARTVIAEGEGHSLRLETTFLHERMARNMGARLARLADQSQAVLDRLPAVEAALAQARAAGVSEFAQASAELQATRAILGETAIAARATALRVESQEARFTAMDGRLLAVQNAADLLRADLAAVSAREEIARLEAEQDNQARAVTDLESRLTGLMSRENGSLEQRIAGRLEAAHKDITRLDAMHASFAQRLEREGAQAVSELESRLAGLMSRENGSLEQRVTGRLEATRQEIARLDALHANLTQRLEQEGAHAAALDAHLKAVREAGVAELAQAVSALESRLTELVSREDELLERRVAGRLAALESIEHDVESLRAALATFGKRKR